MNRRHELRVLALSVALALALAATVGCGDDDGAASGGEGESGEPGTAPRGTTTPAGADGPVVTEESEIDRIFPLHGAVTGTRLRIFSEANEEAPVVGWLRTGAKIRLSGDTQRGPECRAGYSQVWPTGWVCTAEGIEAEEAASRGALVLPPGPRDQPLPYDYYFVKETTVPEYHRLPSRNEQRAALAFAAHYEELLGFNSARAAAYLGGETGTGPAGTAIAARYLDRGFMIAGSGIELRASRRFVRTTGGRFIKQSQLEARNGSDFHGVELGEEFQLPVAWALRTSRPWRQREADDGTVSFHEDSDAEPIERQTFLDGWAGQRNIGGQVMHDIGGDRYLRAWFAAVAEPLDRPDEVGADEPWVHVDLSAQTLVLYHGDEATFATLISSGIEDNETPIGVFEIRNKHITTTMANIG
ncbi:MAG: L,D-transpeptidase, partial [Deltaproteobacteria bacterium]|nr:L,D-transpeptidase [Deltaproteobacteria bacterium]